MNSMTIDTLIDSYINHLATTSPSTMPSVRANLRRLLRCIDASEPASRFLMHIDQRIGTLSNTSPPTPPTSIRAIRSHLRGAIRWGIDERMLAVPSELAEQLGVLAEGQFAHWRADPKALTVYKLLLAELAICGTSISDVDEEFFAHFMEQLPSHIAGWRSCWSAFMRRWRTLAAEGTLPEIEPPTPPSKKPSSFAVRESDLPLALQEELRHVRARLEGTMISDRMGSPSLDESTQNLVLGTLMRLLGFLKSTQGIDLGKISLRGALELDNARTLLGFTSARYFSRMGLLAERDSSGRIVLGEYELGILRQLAAVVRLGLRDDRLHEEYSEEIRFVMVGVRNRRESRKKAGHVEDYYRVALTLAERAVAADDSLLMTVTTATQARDAVIFALLAAHGYRRGVLAGIDVKTHVRESTDGVVTICVPREETKPKRRDLQLELPRELLGLWRLYIQKARPALLCGEREDSLLIAQGGKPLSNAAIYAVVVSRSDEVLEVRHNPHQVRKAIATDHGIWSGGDYLSVSAVLDASPLILQRHYAELQGVKLIAQFDSATSSDWKKIEGGTAA